MLNTNTQINQVGGVITEDLFYNINPFDKHESKYFLNLFYGYMLDSLDKKVGPSGNSLLKKIFSYSALKNNIKKDYNYVDTSFSKIYSIIFFINEANKFDVSNNYKKIKLNEWSNFILITYLLNKIVSDIYLNENIKAYTDIFMECNNTDKILGKILKKKTQKKKSNLQSAAVLNNATQNKTKRNMPNNAASSSVSRSRTRQNKNSSKTKSRRQNSNLQQLSIPDKKILLEKEYLSKKFKLDDIFSTCKTFIINIMKLNNGFKGFNKNLEPLFRENKTLLIYNLRLKKEDPTLKKIYNYDLEMERGKIKDKDEILATLQYDLILCCQIYLLCLFRANIVNNNKDKYDFYNNMFVLSGLLKEKLENISDLKYYNELNSFLKVFLSNENYEHSNLNLNLNSFNGSVFNENYIPKVEHEYSKMRLNYKYNDKFDKKGNTLYVSLFNLLDSGNWNPFIPGDRYFSLIKPANNKNKNNTEIKFQNCGENVSRTLISILISDKDYNHDLNLLESLNVSDELKKYFKDYKSMDELNNLDADKRWAALVSGKDELEYARHDYCDLDIERNGVNFFNLIKLLFNLSDKYDKLTDFLEDNIDLFNISDVSNNINYTDNTTTFNKFGSDFTIKLIDGHASFKKNMSHEIHRRQYNFKNNEDIQKLLSNYGLVNFNKNLYNKNLSLYEFVNYYDNIFYNFNIKNRPYKLFFKEIELSNYLIRDNVNITNEYVNKYYLNIDIKLKKDLIILYNKISPQNLQDLKNIRLVLIYCDKNEIFLGNDKVSNYGERNVDKNILLPKNTKRIGFKGFYNNMEDILYNLKTLVSNNKSVDEIIFYSVRNEVEPRKKYKLDFPIVKKIIFLESSDFNIIINNFKELKGKTKLHDKHGELNYSDYYNSNSNLSDYNGYNEINEYNDF
jgi:hypothetical protein